MDDQRFDQLTRALAGASTRRGALAAVAGAAVGLGLAGREADAKHRRRRRKCDPACAPGQTCDKSTRTCRCDNGGAVCGPNCCRTGQRCEGGACIDPAPQCTAAGQPCKTTGIDCCDGRTCASGQGGQADIACYVPAGGACAATAECVFGAACEDGVCVALPPAPTCEASACPTCPAYNQQGIDFSAVLVPGCDGGACTCSCKAGGVLIPGSFSMNFTGVSCTAQAGCGTGACSDMVAGGPCLAGSAYCCCATA